MVAPQVAPELMQPNVMVEIDHGPPMELRQEAKWPLPGSSRPHVHKSMSAVEAISMSTLPLNRGEHELISDDVRPTTSLRCGGNFWRGKESSLRDDVIDVHKRRMRITLDSTDQTLTASQDEFKTLIDKTKGLNGCVATRLDDSNTLMRPPQLKDARVPATAATQKEEIIVIGTSCSWPMKDNNWCGWATGPYSTCRSSGNSETVHDWTASEFLSPPDSEESSTGFLSTAEIASVLAFSFSHMVIEQFEDIHYRDAKTRGHLGLPASTSWTNGPKTSSIVNAADVSKRDILMWMIEYNLMNSPCESERITHLSNQSTELLLNMVAAAISCFHFLLSARRERKLNAKQCTGKVHCLLKEPG